MSETKVWRLLYADDTEADRKRFAAHFDALPDFKVEVCDLSPFAIKQRIRAGGIDALILDVRYDGGGDPHIEVQAGFGVQVLDGLAEELKQQNIRVILHSTQDIATPGSDVARAMTEALDRHGPEGTGLIPEIGYITKPLQPRQSETLLRLLLSKNGGGE